MAKYNAIYEGRLPYAMFKITSDKKLALKPGLVAIFMNSCNKIYKKVANFFN